MINTHNEIYLFLKTGKEEGFLIIRNIFFKQLSLNAFSILKDYEQSEDLFMDFVKKLFEKRDELLDKFENQEKGLASYVRQMAKNFLRDRLKNLSEINHQPVDIYEGFLRSEKNVPTDGITKLEAINVQEFLDKKLTEDDFTVLCYIIAKDKEDFEKKFLSDLSKDALYKRVQRIKEKLRNLIAERGFSEDGVRYYIEYILPTKCERGKENG